MKLIVIRWRLFLHYKADKLSGNFKQFLLPQKHPFFDFWSQKLNNHLLVTIHVKNSSQKLVKIRILPAVQRQRFLWP